MSSQGNQIDFGFGFKPSSESQLTKSKTFTVEDMFDFKQSEPYPVNNFFGQNETSDRPSIVEKQQNLFTEEENFANIFETYGKGQVTEDFYQLAPFQTTRSVNQIAQFEEPVSLRNDAPKDIFEQKPLDLFKTSNNDWYEDPPTNQAQTNPQRQSVKSKSSKEQGEINFDEFMNYDENANVSAGDDSLVEKQRIFGDQLPAGGNSQHLENASKTSRSIGDIEDLMKRQPEQGRILNYDSQFNEPVEIPHDILRNPLEMQLNRPPTTQNPYTDFPYQETQSPVPVQFDRFLFESNEQKVEVQDPVVFNLKDFNTEHSERQPQRPVMPSIQEQPEDDQSLLTNQRASFLYNGGSITSLPKQQELVNENANQFLDLFKSEPIPTLVTQDSGTKFFDQFQQEQPPIVAKDDGANFFAQFKKEEKVVDVTINVLDKKKQDEKQTPEEVKAPILTIQVENPFFDFDDVAAEQLGNSKQLYSLEEFLQQQIDQPSVAVVPAHKPAMPSILETDDEALETPSVPVAQRASLVQKSSNFATSHNNSQEFPPAQDESQQKQSNDVFTFNDSQVTQRKSDEEKVVSLVGKWPMTIQVPQNDAQSKTSLLDVVQSSPKQFHSPKQSSTYDKDQFFSPMQSRTGGSMRQIDDPFSSKKRLSQQQQQISSQESIQLLNQVQLQAKTTEKVLQQTNRISELIESMVPTIIQQVKASLQDQSTPQKTIELLEQRLQGPILEQGQRVTALENKFSQLNTNVMEGYEKLHHAFEDQQQSFNLMPMMLTMSRDMTDLKDQINNNQAVTQQDERRDNQQEFNNELLYKIQFMEAKLEESNVQLIKLNEKYDQAQSQKGSLVYSPDNTRQNVVEHTKVIVPASPLDDHQWEHIEAQNNNLIQSKSIRPYMSQYQSPASRYNPSQAAPSHRLQASDKMMSGRARDSQLDHGFDREVMKMKTNGVFISKYLKSKEQVEIFKKMCLQDSCTILDTFELFISCRYEVITVQNDGQRAYNVVKLVVTYRNKSHMTMNHLIVIVDTQQVTDRFFVEPLKISRSKLEPKETAKQEFVFQEFDPSTQTLTCAIGYMFNHLRRQFTVQLARPVSRFLDAEFLGAEDLINQFHQHHDLIVQSDMFTLGALKSVDQIPSAFTWLLELQEEDKPDLKQVAGKASVRFQGNIVDLLIRFLENRAGKCVVQIALLNNNNQKLSEALLSYFVFVVGM